MPRKKSVTAFDRAILNCLPARVAEIPVELDAQGVDMGYEGSVRRSLVKSAGFGLAYKRGPVWIRLASPVIPSDHTTKGT